MTTYQRTDIILGSYFINSSELGELLDLTSQRNERSIQCTTNVSNCPKCSNKIRKTRNYWRKIDHLTERINYEIIYSYCDYCKLGWPNLPPNVLPNMNVGLDVMGHIAYWHILKQQSYSTLKLHLGDCHGIWRNETTIGRYIDRFNILCENSLKLFDELIRAYLSSQKTKMALFDEAFFDSLYNEKLCLALFLLPECRVIAGLNVTNKRSRLFLEKVMKNFQQKIGELDVIGVDMSPFYSSPISVAFTAASIQFCVFHFFNLLYEKIIHPRAIKSYRLLQKENLELKKELKCDFKQLKEKLPGEYFGLCRDLEKRIQWCLDRRWITYTLIELQQFRMELQKRYSNPKKTKNFTNETYQFVKDFRSGLIKVNRKIRQWETKIKHMYIFNEFKEMTEYVCSIQELFRETNFKTYNKRLKELKQISDSSQNQNIHKIYSYLEQYQENLSIYLHSGRDKATSLIEQVFQRMKKTTRNYRGGHYESSMHKFTEMYRFFWNTEPLKLKSEVKQYTRSPFARMGENSKIILPIDMKQRWWNWLYQLDYFTYRKRVLRDNKERWHENMQVKSRKIHLNQKSVKNREERAKYRWKHSRTLTRVETYVKNEIDRLKPPKRFKESLKSIYEHDQKLYHILLKYPEGKRRSELETIIKLPKTVVYESLERLESNYLIVRRRRVIRKGGKPATLFIPLLFDYG